MSKKRLGIVIAVLLIGVMAFGVIGSGAWFTDAETAENNLFTAGTLDLKVDGLDDPNVIHIAIDDMKPGDTENQYWTLKNVGSICGQPSIEFSNIVDYENGCTEPEGALDSSCGNTGPGEGELGGILYVLMKRDGSETIKMTMYGHTKLSYLAGPYGLGENGGTPIPVLCENDEVKIEFRVWWDGRFSTPADNKAQSDSVEFDVVFHLDQVH
ncbi:MAG: TasA family protein [Microgenomates group bacterium]